MTLLLRTGSFAVPPNGRGRPRLDALTLREYLRAPSIKIARRVFREEAALGSARGSPAEAIRRVAGYLGIDDSTVKKIAQRHRDRRGIERTLYRMHADIGEIDRRMRGLPDDLRAALLSRGHHGRLLTMLRDNGIDGTSPAWFIELMRR